MPSKNEPRERGPLRLGWLLLVTVPLGGGRLAAQELPLFREYPGSGPYVCAAVGPAQAPSPEEGAQARQLASTAAQAVILGDPERALSLLARATELDSTSADLAYQHGRVLEDLGDGEAARAEYCRVLALGGALQGLGDARTRIQAITTAEREAIPESAREGFGVAVSWADAEMPAQALTTLDEALALAPDWPVAVYNRGVLLDRLGRGQEAVDEFRRYLQLLEPDAAIELAVSQRIGQLEGVAMRPGPSPGATLTLGMLFPGMGHYYAGRRISGTIVLGLAGGAAAAGLLTKKNTIRCFTPPSDGGPCPAGQVVDVTTSRPLLLPALGAAAAITFIGAVEASLRARSSGEGSEPEEGGEEVGTERPGPGLAFPSVTTSGARVDLNLVRFRLR